MDAELWIARCAARLLREWSVLSIQDVDAMALDLFDDDRSQALQPEIAAQRWIDQVTEHSHRQRDNHEN